MCITELMFGTQKINWHREKVPVECRPIGADAYGRCVVS
jgi:hypothetical protein